MGEKFQGRKMKHPTASPKVNPFPCTSPAPPQVIGDLYTDVPFVSMRTKVRAGRRCYHILTQLLDIIRLALIF